MAPLHPATERIAAFPIFPTSQHHRMIQNSISRTCTGNLPEESIPYYVGPLSGSVAERLQSYFPSGDQVRQLGPISLASLHSMGILVKQQQHQGLRFIARMRISVSYNLTLVGWKIWILIKLHHTTKFEDLVRRLTNCDDDDDCDQFVRHTSVVIPPSRLRVEGIEFNIIYSGAGRDGLDSAETVPCCPVINRTAASFAIATNFVLPDENPIPKRLSPYAIWMGLYHLGHPMIRKLRDLNRDGTALFYSMLQKVECAHNACARLVGLFRSGIFGSVEFQERPFKAQPYKKLSTLSLAELLQLL